MDHKAIANNQKLKTTEFVQVEDFDKQAADQTKTEGAQSATLGNDTAVDLEFYRS